MVFVVLLEGIKMERVPMTADGYARLGTELKRLKTVERPSIIKAISAAREHGDLSENAEYHAARERQSFVEGRVRELEDKMSRAEVIDVSKLSGKQIKFGATVTLADEETDEKKTYQLVGADEADVNDGRLSITSPVARALIGRGIGDGRAGCDYRRIVSRHVGDCQCHDRRWRRGDSQPAALDRREMLADAIYLSDGGAAAQQFSVHRLFIIERQPCRWQGKQR